MERVPVAVVGGGMAGLAAAWELKRRGVGFVLLEGASRFGGVVRTDEVDGFLLEGGPDAILSFKPAGLALCRELGLEDEVVPTNPAPRTVWVRRRGRLHPLPEGMAMGVPSRLWPMVTTPLFSWMGKLRLALEPLRPARRDAEDESLANFLRRRLGEEAVDVIGQPLLAGIHAGDAERLSVRANFPMLVDMEQRHGSLTRAFRAARRGAGTPFVSLRRGLGSIAEAVVRELGPGLRSGTAVSAVKREPAGFRLELAGGEALHADAAILAVPAPSAARLLEDAVPAAAVALRDLRFASTATVLLGYRRGDVRHPLDGYGFVSTSREGRVTACTFLSSKLPGRAPEGHVLLRAFLGGARDPGVLALEDGQMVALARRELDAVLGLAAAPVLARVYRWPEAIPQMEVGHAARLASVERALQDCPGLFLTGAGLRGTGIPDTVADARRTAEAAAGSAAAPGAV